MQSLKAAAKTKAKAKASTSSGPGSSRGEQAPAAPKTKGKKVVVATEGVDPARPSKSDPEEEPEEDQEEEEDDMEALRKLQEAAAKKPARGRPSKEASAKKRPKTEE